MNVAALSLRLAPDMEIPNLQCSSDYCRFARFENPKLVEESSEDQVSVR